MGANNENKGIIVGVCLPMMEFLVQQGIVQVVHDNTRDVVVYQPTRDAEAILRKALPEPEEE